jgi:hypothetical protein
MMVIQEIHVIQLEIGAVLSENLLPAFTDKLGTVGPRLAKLVFDELKGRGFENSKLVSVARSLMQALGSALLAEDSEDAEYISDYSSSDGSDKEEEDMKEGAHNGKQSTS